MSSVICAATGSGLAPRNRLGAIITMAGLTAFGALSTDMYLPGFAAIQADLGGDPGLMQMSLSLFLIGLALGQVVFGPLADSLGRRKPLLAGTALFVVASVLTALAPTIQVFLIARLLQGIGGSAGQTVPRAIVRDLYGPAESVKIFTLLIQIMSLAPILAPLIGTALLDAGWRLIFWVLALIGLAALLATFWLIPESRPAETRIPLNLKSCIGSYAQVFRSRRCFGLTLSFGLAMASLFAYISGSPFVLMEYFKLSPTLYSVTFAAIATGMIVLAQSSRWLSPSFQLRLGFGLHLSGVTLLLLATALHLTILPVVIGLLFVAVSSLCLMFSGLTGAAMHSAPKELSGAASAFLGVTQFTLGGLSGMALGILYNGTLLPFAAVMFVCSVSSFVLWRAYSAPDENTALEPE